MPMTSRLDECAKGGAARHSTLCAAHCVSGINAARAPLRSSRSRSALRHDRLQEHSRLLLAVLRRGARKTQKDEAEEIRITDDERHPVLQLSIVRPPRLLGPRPPRLREHHSPQHRLLHPGHGVPVHRDHLGVRQASGDGAGDRAGARAHLRARQGLLQEDGVVLDVQQAEQGAVGVGDLLAHRGEPAAVHAVQEAPVHGRVALLAGPPGRRGRAGAAPRPRRAARAAATMGPCYATCLLNYRTSFHSKKCKNVEYFVVLKLTHFVELIGVVGVRDERVIRLFLYFNYYFNKL